MNDDFCFKHVLSEQGTIIVILFVKTPATYERWAVEWSQMSVQVAKNVKDGPGLDVFGYLG
jgi:hypothetical protein